MEKKTKDIILTIIILVWFFGSLFGGIYLLYLEKFGISLAVFGQLAIIFGITMLFSKTENPAGELVPNRDRKIGFIPLLFGILLLIISALFLFSTKDFQIFFSENLVPLIGTSIFIIVGISIIVVNKQRELKNIKIYNNPILGTCINVTDNSMGTLSLYTITWTYFINGQTFTFYEKVVDPNTPQIDDTCTLYVNPNNLKEVYRTIEIKSPKEAYIFGLFFATLGAIGFLTCLTSTFPNLLK